MPKRRKNLMAEINVVPYIDVMLVLLVIFIATAPLLMQGVKVNLPKVAAKPISAKQQQPIILSVDSKGKYYLNIFSKPKQKLLAHEVSTQVAAAIRVAKQNHNKRAVLLKGDKDVDYGTIMRAMVLLQHAGAVNVGLITENEKNRRH